MTSTTTTVARVPDRFKALGALAALNFFMADARDGLGPFLDAYLITKGWSPLDLGLLATVGGAVGLVAGPAAGALVDASHRKRLLVAAPVVLITLLAFASIVLPIGIVVFPAQIATSLLGLVIGPGIIAISLGIVGRQAFAERVSSNEVWNHAGNIVLLACTYFVSQWAGLSGVATLMVVTTTAAVLATWAIDPTHIDHAIARGLEESETVAAPSSMRLLLENRSLLLFAATLMLFHFGNAPIARLIAQQFAISHEQPFQTTAIITIVGQISAIIGALCAPAAIRRFGISAVILFALISLPIRGVIAAQSGAFAIIYPVQFLDGLGAGLLGILAPIALERMLAGTGHFNLGLAAVGTVQGIGATSSNLVAGYIVETYGYQAAYLFHGLISALAISAFLMARKGLRQPAS